MDILAPIIVFGGAGALILVAMQLPFILLDLAFTACKNVAPRDQEEAD